MIHQPLQEHTRRYVTRKQGVQSGAESGYCLSRGHSLRSAGGGVVDCRLPTHLVDVWGPGGARAWLAASTTPTGCVASSPGRRHFPAPSLPRDTSGTAGIYSSWCDAALSLALSGLLDSVTRLFSRCAARPGPTCATRALTHT